MALSTGTRLGPYEIVAPLGAGGMGEVYRARDTRLERTVAIKVLNSALVASPESRARFEREAKTISQLNDPHICVLYDVGHEGDIDFLVMEFLEGESLADRLKRGPLPCPELLKIAAQIAEALQKAHRADIVHRDLKPGNVMLTKSGAKLLDFGLAKPAIAVSASAAAPVTPATPTIDISSLTSPVTSLTQEGSIVGTFQYMAPEVLEGRAADARSDIFAFGTVLYEMAAGRRAFEGKSQLAVISAVLSQEPPPIATIRPEVPVGLRHLIVTCMAKDPEERFQTAHDIKLQLKWISENPESGPQAARSSNAMFIPKLGWITAALTLILLAGLALLHWGGAGRSHDAPILSFVPAPMEVRLSAFHFDGGPAVISPDGSRLAFSAINKDGSIKLWLRPLNSRNAIELAGTDNASYPFWSPDGRAVAFFADSRLKTIDLTNNSVQVVCDVVPGSSGVSATWGVKGTIVLIDNSAKPVQQVSASGGVPVPLAFQKPEQNYGSPYFLPDGDHFLFDATPALPARGSQPATHIRMASLSSNSDQDILADASQGVYADGQLLFRRGSQVWAQAFDAHSGKLSGTALALTDATTFSVGGPVLAFQRMLGDSHLQWFDPDGQAQGIVGPVASYSAPRISPDGKRVLADVVPDVGGLAIYSIPAAGGVSTRLTFGDSAKTWTVWSPDGKYIAYGSEGPDGVKITRKLSDGSGAEEVLYKLDPDISFAPTVDWSLDGRYISFDARSRKSGRFQAYVLPLFGDRKPFIVSPSSVSQFDGMFSPDGRWFAFFTYETGRPEVFVVPFPGPGGKYQISNGGGWELRWGKGNRIYFMSTGNRLMEADLEFKGQSLQVNSVRSLFALPLLDVSEPLFDITADGKHILAVTPANPEANSIGLLTNWRSLLPG